MSTRESSGDLPRGLSRKRSQSSRSQSSRGTRDRAVLPPPPHADTANPETTLPFEPCAATGSFFLYAQRNIIVALHHDTLAIERRFDKHLEDVSIIACDTTSELGQGRLVCSYDVAQIAIVWDLFTGDEMARFESYDPIRVAAFMRNGNIAFGNILGNVILFEPTTSEHISTQTIYDPITALAPAIDCRTYAIGYQNGSVLIATLLPTFSILFTLNIQGRGPSPITGLAWHGSSSRQPSEMLATQTADGDLRVWSISKPPLNDPPRVIRVLGTGEAAQLNRSWFAWSKNGRIIQYFDGETRAWDVRTKTVSNVPVQTVDNVISIANYGPTATLFTLSPNNGVQQYDLNPSNVPLMVANVQHAPINAPPTPPDSMGNNRLNGTSLPLVQQVHEITTDPEIVLPNIEVESTDEEGDSIMSPLDKIAREMDQLEDERRDMVGPLSPVSSSRASLSSASSYGGRRPKESPRNHSFSSKASEASSAGTFFSTSTPLLQPSGRENVSIRTTSSQSSRRTGRKSQPRIESNGSKLVDLFPFTRARLSEVKYRSPQYGSSASPEVLRREMLSVVFGWDHDIESLIVDERSRHLPASIPSILLSKWLGDSGADDLAQMIGTQSMASSDWMFLALSIQMGQGEQQKHVFEAFVRRLLDQGEIHPAVAILLGLGNQDAAVDAYVSRKLYLEAVLLTCLMFPNDWQRQSQLVRKWGQSAAADGENEIAVRCFACASNESSDILTSPTSPPTSPPSATAGPNRLKAKNASLKLITNFGDKAAPKSQTLPNNVGFTPIAESATSPGGAGGWKRSTSKGLRDPSSARTATPGGYGRRKRMPSAEPGIREDPDGTPHVGTHRLPSRPSSRMSNKDPGTAVKASVSNTLTSPAASPSVFRMRKEASRNRDGSKDRNHHRLHLDVVEVEETEDAISPRPSTASTTSTAASRRHRSGSSLATESRPDDFSPLLTDGSSKSFKGRSIDRYISSLEEANVHAQRLRAESKSRAEERSRSRARTARDKSTGRPGVSYVKPGKHSPSSPVPMSAVESSRHTSITDSNTEDERFYGIISPVESQSSNARGSSRQQSGRLRTSSKGMLRNESPERPGLRSGSRTARGLSKGRSRPSSPDGTGLRDDRGRSSNRRVDSHNRSPSSPSPMEPDGSSMRPRETIGAASRARSRQRSLGKVAIDTTYTGAVERSSRARSSSRRPRHPEFEPRSAVERSSDEIDEAFTRVPDSLNSRARGFSTKELAAKELEERRLSLARRPSAPSIPHPGELSGRPNMSPRAMTDQASYFASGPYNGDLSIQRSQTVDPDAMSRYQSGLRTTSISTKANPIGLPATPRAMRHSRHIGQDDTSAVPDIPAIPESFQTLASVSYEPKKTAETDSLGPLLPSSVYGGGSRAPARSSSAPPEKSMGLPGRPRRDSKGSISHGRHGSERGQYVAANMRDAGDEESQIVVVPEVDEPHVLAELAHLAGPPPPPPPPLAINTNSSAAGTLGVINIAMENASPSSNQLGLGDSRTTTPAMSTSERPTPSASPNTLRKNHGSGTSTTSESISSKWKNVRDRMRSDSRNRKIEAAGNRTKSPATPGEPQNASPYETVLPQFPGMQRTLSPQNEQQSWLATQDRPTTAQSPEPAVRERRQREIRANMPPSQLQAGVYTQPPPPPHSGLQYGRSNIGHAHGQRGSGGSGYE